MYFKYQLAKRGKWVCPECGRKTFVCYVDAGGNVLNERVGKCDRADKCAFHYPPKQYFEEHQSVSAMMQPRRYYQPQYRPIPQPEYIDTDVFKKTLHDYGNNNLIVFLSSVFGAALIRLRIAAYFIGTSQYWKGSTVFWQVDRYGKVHRGKIMQYNAENGKRVKEPYSHITSVNSVLKLGDNQPPQCLFGEHLLTDFPDDVVAIVESEKTAIIASCVFGDCITLACGGCGNLTPSMCEALRGRDVVLFPDNGKFNEWRDKGYQMRRVFSRLRISQFMEHNAVHEGDDFGDWVLLHYPKGDWANVDLSLIEL